jgi:hypothetical protein
MVRNAAQSLSEGREQVSTEPSSAGLPTVYAPLELSELAHPTDSRIAHGGLILAGEVGISAAKALASLAGTSSGGGAPVQGEALFRLAVMDPHLREGLAKGTLRFATPGKGDASVLIKQVSNGQHAGSAKLIRAGATSGKAAGAGGAAASAAVAGPAIAAAAAAAIILYQLDVISTKLDVIGRDVKRVIEQLQLAQDSSLKELRDTARRVVDKLDVGDRVSDALGAELATELASVRRVWRELYEQAVIDVAKYRQGSSDIDHRAVLRSWFRVLQATQVIAEAVQAVIRLAAASSEQFELVLAEQQQLLSDRLDEVRRLAGELYDAHLHWRAEKAEFDLSLTLNPAKFAARSIKRGSLRKPRQRILDEGVAWQCGQLAAPPPAPDALLLTLRSDGRVSVAVEARELPAAS